MGRSRGFDESEVLVRAAAQFLETGYEGTSLDALVAATGLHRGSLYAAFGSKRGLFIAALTRAGASGSMTDDVLDLALVALLELAPVDDEVRASTLRLLAPIADGEIALTLGSRLIVRAGITPSSISSGRKAP